MQIVLAQAAEITDAASRWGDQAPVLALGFVAFGALVYFFLRHLKAREEAMAEDSKARSEEARQERQERDALFSATIREVSERSDATARVCHETQRAATDRERETAEVLGSVRGALERTATVTVEIGRAVEEARRESERSRPSNGR